MEKLITDTIDNGTIENVHIAPIGDFIGSSSDGAPIDEHITAESLQNIADDLNSNNEEVLMDIDHQSTKNGADKNTSAVGWFSKFIVDPIKGLFATLKLTKSGKELLENREYRYVSPTFMLDENGSPAMLHSVAATNLPAFKGHINPILNSESTQIEKTSTKEKDILNMNKEELIALIKQIISEMKVAEEVAEVKEEIKEEVIENSCGGEENKTEEVKNEEIVEDTKKEEEEPKKKEEVKEEVVKIEALNSAPAPILNSEPVWKKLHGKEFFDWCEKHPNGI